jgi:hypothetical protein
MYFVVGMIYVSCNWDGRADSRGIHIGTILNLYTAWKISTAGHRHRGWCRRHWHSGILYLSPVPKHSGTELGPLIPKPDWFRHRIFCSFRYRTDWMPDSPTFRHLKKLLHIRCWWKGYPVHFQTAGSGKWYTLHVHRQLLMVLFLLYDIENSYVNAGEKLVRHRHFFR